MPRKTSEPDPTPPGPLFLELRVGDANSPTGKVVFRQRVHAYNIDQQTHQITITGDLKPTGEKHSNDEVE